MSSHLPHELAKFSLPPEVPCQKSELQEWQRLCNRLWLVRGRRGGSLSKCLVICCNAPHQLPKGGFQDEIVPHGLSSELPKWSSQLWFETLAGWVMHFPGFALFCSIFPLLHSSIDALYSPVKLLTHKICLSYSFLKRSFCSKYIP